MSKNKNFVKFGKEFRKCSKCGKTFPATKEYFSPQIVRHKRKTKKDIKLEIWTGLRPDCKECRREEGRINHHKKKGHYISNGVIENRSGGMGLI